MKPLDGTLQEYREGELIVIELLSGEEQMEKHKDS